MPAAAPAARRAAPALLLGAALLIVSAGLFGALAEGVATGGRLASLDADLAAWLHRHASPALVGALLVVTHLHSTIAVSCYAAVAAAVLAARGRRGLAAALLVCVGGGLAVNALMKLAFERARPAFDDPLLTLSTYSFPSGHVAGSTIAYGLVIAWVFGATASRWRRALALVGALAAIALVAFSRMALGVHYLSDVVAAFAEGVVWLAICAGALAAARRYRRPSAGRSAG